MRRIPQTHQRLDRKIKLRQEKKPRQIEIGQRTDRWNVIEENLYVKEKKRRLPGWVLPLVILMTTLIVVLWVAPSAIRRRQVKNDTDKQVVETIYGSDDAVVIVSAADIFAEPKLRSPRVTQVLFNESIKILSEPLDSGFTNVQLRDGIKGFIRTSSYSTDTSGIEPARAELCVVVRDSSKRIMSHASNGTLLVEAPMGSVLYGDYKSSNVVRVYLSDGQTGWLGTDNLLIMDCGKEHGEVVEGSPPMLSASDGTEMPVRYFTSSLMSFHNAVWMPHGLTRQGISMEGALFIAARVNGLDIGRTIEQQIAIGESVDLPIDPETQLPDVNRIRTGDVLMIGAPEDAGRLHTLAIRMDDGRFLMVLPNASTLSLEDISHYPEILERIISVRRLFP